MASPPTALVLWDNDHLLPASGLSSLCVEGVSEHEPLTVCCVIGPQGTGKRWLASRLTNTKTDTLFPAPLNPGLWLLAPPRGYASHKAPAMAIILVVLTSEMMDATPGTVSAAARQHLLAMGSLLSSQILFNTDDSLGSDAQDLLLSVIKACASVHAHKGVTTHAPRLLVLFRSVPPVPSTSGKLLPEGSSPSELLEQELKTWVHATARDPNNAVGATTSVIAQIRATLDQQFPQSDRNAILFPTSDVIHTHATMLSAPSFKSIKSGFFQAPSPAPHSASMSRPSTSMHGARANKVELPSVTTQPMEEAPESPPPPLSPSMHTAMDELTTYLNASIPKYLQGHPVTLGLIRILLHTYINVITPSSPSTTGPVLVTRPSSPASTIPSPFTAKPVMTLTSLVRGKGGPTSETSGPSISTSITDGLAEPSPTTTVASPNSNSQAQGQLHSPRSVALPAVRAAIRAKAIGTNAAPPTYLGIPTIDALMHVAMDMQFQTNADLCFMQFASKMAGAASMLQASMVSQAYGATWDNVRTQYLNSTARLDGELSAQGLRELRVKCDSHYHEVLERVRNATPDEVKKAVFMAKKNQNAAVARLQQSQAPEPVKRTGTSRRLSNAGGSGSLKERPSWEEGAWDEGRSSLPAISRSGKDEPFRRSVTAQDLLGSNTRNTVDQSQAMSNARPCYAFAPRLETVPLQPRFHTSVCLPKVECLSAPTSTDSLASPSPLGPRTTAPNLSITTDCTGLPALPAARSTNGSARLAVSTNKTQSSAGASALNDEEVLRTSVHLRALVSSWDSGASAYVGGPRSRRTSQAGLVPLSPSKGGVTPAMPSPLSV